MAKKRPKVGAPSTNMDMKKGIEEALEIGKKVAGKNTPQVEESIVHEINEPIPPPKTKAKKAVESKTKQAKAKPIDRNKYRKEVHKIAYISKDHHEKAKIAAFHQRITMRQYIENLIDKNVS